MEVILKLCQNRTRKESRKKKKSHDAGGLWRSTYAGGVGTYHGGSEKAIMMRGGET